MTRLIIVLGLIFAVVLYANRRRLKPLAYRVRAVLQNPSARAQFLRRFFYSLGRITRFALLRRFFRW